MPSFRFDFLGEYVLPWGSWLTETENGKMEPEYQRRCVSGDKTTPLIIPHHLTFLVILGSLGVTWRLKQSKKLHDSTGILYGGFKDFVFSPLLGEDSYFD